jgi:Zn-dependent protease
MSLDTVMLIIIVMYSVILHEISHGYVALWCGDNTAKYANRLTLNPWPHVDTVGTIILPVIGVMSGLGVFGYAKGVPVNMYNLNTKLKEFLVSAAGIITNLFLALIFILIYKYNYEYNFISEIYNNLILKAAIINIGLAFFNLLPIPPFDGMQILRSIFPSLKHKYQHIEHNPAFMIGAIIFAMFIFSFIYSDLVNFILSIFL